MTSQQQSFPFFVGCGRSGTTLFRAIFDSHAEMAIPPESSFVRMLATRQHHYDDDGDFDTARFARDLLAQSSFRRWGLEERDVRRALAEAEPDDYANAVRTVYSLYARTHGKSTYGDKTPPFILHIPLLAREFDDATFVHIIRDGRDVAMSLLEQEWGIHSVIAGAQFWKRRVERGRRTGLALGSDRYLEVHYEDLLDDPHSVVERVCEFIKLPFDPAMFRYMDRADDIVGGTAFPHRHKRISLPPTKGLRDWRTQMDPADVERFEVIAGQTLESFGYERTTSPTRHGRIETRSKEAVATMVRVSGHRRLRRKVRHARRRLWPSNHSG